MRLLLLILILSLSSFANIKSFIFFYTGHEARQINQLDCDYARHQVEKSLTQIGATQIEIHCKTAPQDITPRPLSLMTKFRLETNDLVGEKIHIRSTSTTNCYFNTKLINSILLRYNHFKVLKFDNTCIDEDTKYSYQIQFL